MVRLTTAVAVLGMVATLVFGVPHRAMACGCCACDFGGGDIECGTRDMDCTLCIDIGGVPATDCSACTSPSGECLHNTFCVDHETGMCGGDPIAAPAPALTPLGLIATALLLVSAGVLTLRRRMRGR